MRRIDQLRARLRSLLRRNVVEHELDAELRFHLDQQIDENLAAGMDREEARYRALRTIGGIAQIQEQCRDARRLNLMESFVKDVIYAARMLRKSPAFTLTAVLSLGLSIGANAAVFSLINRLLLARLGVTDPGSLVAVKREPPEPPAVPVPRLCGFLRHGQQWQRAGAGHLPSRTLGIPELHLRRPEPFDGCIRNPKRKHGLEPNL